MQIRHRITCDMLFVWNNSICVIKRRYDPKAGFWALPGGHLNINESTRDAAIREFIEETNFNEVINTDEIKLAAIADSPNRIPGYEDRPINIIYKYVASTEPILSASDDAQEIKFIPISDIISGKEILAFDHDIIVELLCQK